MGEVIHIRPRKGLTASQELIWTSQRRTPETPLANMANLTRFGQHLDRRRFIAAFDQVARASDMLRSTFEVIDGIPRRRVHVDPLSHTELCEVHDDELEHWIAERIARPIDLDACVYDSVLLHLTDSGQDAWWLNVHHIATDAASSAALFQAVAAAYEGREFAIGSYDDVALALDRGRSSTRSERAAEYWKTASIPISDTSLYRAPSTPQTEAQRVCVDMSGVRASGFASLLEGELRALSPGLSLTTTLATALAAYLGALGNTSVVFGVPVHHRGGPEAHALIGPLVELFPCPIEVDPGATFRELHKSVGRSLMTTLQNAAPGTGPRQEFDVVLNVTTVRFGDFGSIPTKTRWIHPGHIDAHHRLRLQALNYDATGPQEIALDINHAVADDHQRGRAGEHFGRVLDAMIDDLDQRLDNIVLPGAQEQAELARAAVQRPGIPLLKLAPMAIRDDLNSQDRGWAVHHGDRSWSGSELDATIERVARSLQQRGIDRGDRVAVELPIGFDALAAIHGIQRAGASFVPIDPSYPEQRRRHIAEDSAARFVIRDLPTFLRESPKGSAGPLPTPHLDDEAYVIYTSGSTGLPKGVPITHRGLAEYLGFASATYVDGPLVMPLFTSLSFDLTITTLFVPFLVGGSITLHPDGGLPALREIVDERRATLLKATPSHLELLVRMIDATHPLNGVIVGGEAFMTDLADRLIDTCADDFAIHNEYGPTEAVVGCMHHRYDPVVDPGPEVPIGMPAPGVELRIAGPAGPAPIGVAGELLISRPGMTSGYIGRPSLNGERFVSDVPGASSTRMYRTGDLVRYLDADRMIYLGRVDEQIKVGGVRLEPGEIEEAATSVQGVARAVAGLWRSDSQHSSVECVRCGLSSQVPGIAIDADGICSTCHQYDLVAPQAQSWFKTEDDLVNELDLARQAATGKYDVVHLLSGGKDSTYALYSLVELGARVVLPRGTGSTSSVTHTR